MDKTQLPSWRRTEAVHALLLEHLEQVEVQPSLIAALREELALPRCAERATSTSLFNLYRFATDGLVKIQVRGLAGPLCDLEVPSSANVRDVKDLIREQTGIPAHELVLLHDGKNMQDADILVSHRVSPLDRYVSVVRVRPPQLYILGGLDDEGEALASAEMFDSARGEWEVIPPMSRPRHSCVTAVMNRRLYVIGGIGNATHHATAEVLEVPEESCPMNSTALPGQVLPERRWRPLPSMSTARAKCAAAVVEGKIYLFGGDDGYRALNVVEALDLAHETWELLPPMRTARWHSASAVVDGRIYIVGGDDGLQSFACAEAFDVAQRGWDSLPDMNVRRFGLLCENLCGQVCALGGFDGHNMLASAEAFEPGASSWQALPSMWTARTRSLSAVVSGKLYVLGGIDVDDAVSPTCEVYDPVVGGWLPLPVMQDGRADAAMVAAADDRLYVVGGDDGDGPLSSAEVFDVATGAWRRFPPITTARRGPSLVVVDS